MYGNDRLGIGRLRAGLFLVGLPLIWLWSLRETPFIELLLVGLPAALLLLTAALCSGARQTLALPRTSVAAVAAAVIGIATVLWSVPIGVSPDIGPGSDAAESRRMVVHAFGPLALGLLAGLAIARGLGRLRDGTQRPRTMLTTALITITVAALLVSWRSAALASEERAAAVLEVIDAGVARAPALRAAPSAPDGGRNARHRALACAVVAALALVGSSLLARRASRLGRERDAEQRQRHRLSLGAYRDRAEPESSSEPAEIDVLLDRSLALQAIASGALIAAHGISIVAGAR